jgi:homogentisate solanesyltransferase
LTQQQSKAGYQKPQMLSAATLMAGSGAIATHFTIEERIGVARSIIRKFDAANRFHCAVPHCGDRCENALQCCGNVGCGTKFSRKWGPAHDSLCAHKIISCPLLCGEHVVRQNAGAHMANDCIMREVPCPYHHIGCAPPSKH